MTSHRAIPDEAGRYCIACRFPINAVAPSPRSQGGFYRHTRPFVSLATRFWSRVQQGDGCWLWTGQLNEKRYGILGMKSTPKLAHRLSWVFANGPIPDGLNVCHSCDNPLCVNPAHLWLGTLTDNNRDMIAKGRKRNGNESKTRCLRGHLFSGDNLYVWNGHRTCRTCRRESGYLRQSARAERGLMIRDAANKLGEALG